MGDSCDNKTVKALGAKLCSIGICVMNVNKKTGVATRRNIRIYGKTQKVQHINGWLSRRDREGKASGGSAESGRYKRRKKTRNHTDGFFALVFYGFF